MLVVVVSQEDGRDLQDRSTGASKMAYCVLTSMAYWGACIYPFDTVALTILPLACCLSHSPTTLLVMTRPLRIVSDRHIFPEHQGRDHHQIHVMLVQNYISPIAQTTATASSLGLVDLSATFPKLPHATVTSMDSILVGDPGR